MTAKLELLLDTPVFDLAFLSAREANVVNFQRPRPFRRFDFKNRGGASFAE
jgi:hypothetical protein